VLTAIPAPPPTSIWSPIPIPRTSIDWSWPSILDATLPTVGGRAFDPAGDAAVVRRGGNVTADTRFGGLDVVQLAEGVPTYSTLSEDAIESDLLGVPVWVCSLNRLREMKQAQNRTQDQADLENLPDS
jgi:hypothetical protein